MTAPVITTATTSKPRRTSMLRRAVSTATGRIAVAMLMIVVILAIVGSTVLSDAATIIDPSQAYQTSSWAHPLGTDELGRDHFARVAFATPLSLLLALSATAIGIVGGLILGSVSWFSGPRIAALASSVIAITIAFPSLLMILFVSVILGRGAVASVVAVGVAMIPWYARLVQSMVASVREREYVLAALVQGRSRLWVLFRHILPNVGEPLIINATLGSAGALLAFAGLSFIGLGIQAPQYDWGLLLNENMSSIYVTPLPAVTAAAVIVIAGLGFNLLGESFARSLDRDRPVGLDQEVAAPRPVSPEGSPVVQVSDLNVTAGAGEHLVHIVRDVTLTIPARRIVGVVGESGSGKTLTAQAIAQLADESLAVTATELTLNGRTYGGGYSDDPELVTSVGYVFQDSSTAFNPVMRLDQQIPEALAVHQDLGRARAHSLAVDLLDRMGVPDAARRARQYPHEFSGGMRQRAMIAQAVAAGPALIVADEPTTALDVSLKARILDLLRELRDSQGASVLLISHDISTLMRVADDIVVMYGGRIVERGPADVVAAQPAHPYTQALLEAVPTMTTPKELPLRTIPGRPVDLAAAVPGCSFAPRCTRATSVCTTDFPHPQPRPSGGSVSCHHADLHADAQLGMQADATVAK